MEPEEVKPEPEKKSLKKTPGLAILTAVLALLVVGAFGFHIARGWTDLLGSLDGTGGSAVRQQQAYEQAAAKLGTPPLFSKGILYPTCKLNLDCSDPTVYYTFATYVRNESSLPAACKSFLSWLNPLGSTSATATASSTCVQAFSDLTHNDFYIGGADVNGVGGVALITNFDPSGDLGVPPYNGKNLYILLAFETPSTRAYTSRVKLFTSAKQ